MTPSGFDTKLHVTARKTLVYKLFCEIPYLRRLWCFYWWEEQRYNLVFLTTFSRLDWEMGMDGDYHARKHVRWPIVASRFWSAEVNRAVKQPLLGSSRGLVVYAAHLYELFRKQMQTYSICSKPLLFSDY
jgi:hypothetical protein